jgi:hypothetical protein
MVGVSLSRALCTELVLGPRFEIARIVTLVQLAGRLA